MHPYHYFKKVQASDIVLEDDPPDLQVDGTPLTESLAESWSHFTNDGPGTAKVKVGEYSFLMVII